MSNQIENEDQIMGAQQEMEPEECEEDKDGSKENQAEDADGVEMEQEFDGELHDGELEPEGEDEEDAAEVSTMLLLACEARVLVAGCCELPDPA